MSDKVLVVDSRPSTRARLTQMLDQLQVPYTVVAAPTLALNQLIEERPAALITARYLANLSGPALVALAQSLSPKLDCLIVDQPDQDRGLVESLARRLRAAAGAAG